MKIIKRIVAVVVFSALVFGLLVEGGRYLLPEDTGAGFSFSSWEQFYAEDEDSMEVVLIGSSAIYRYWIAPQAYQEYGFTSYMATTASQPFVAIPYIMEEVAKTQDVDVFVVETRSVYKDALHASKENFDEESYEEERTFYEGMVAAGMKFSWTKYNYLKAAMPELSVNELVEWMFPLLKYHDNLWDMTKEELLERLEVEKHPYKTASQATSHKALTQREWVWDQNYVLREEDKQQIDAIVEMAEKLGKEVLFVATPYTSTTKQRSSMQADLNRYMEEKAYPYFNMNDYVEEANIDFATDFYNANHANILGAEKVTTYLGAYLTEHYPLGDMELSDAQKAEWDEVAEAWEVEAARLREICLKKIAKKK